jgi:uncharacterized protein YdbL (DUF1318 family)
MAAAAVLLAAVTVRADGLDAVKARMLSRVSAVVALANTQKSGENNQGYLVARASLTGDEQKILDQENADRKQVYEEIAAKTKVAVAQVGAQRALAIAKQAAAGSWLQDSAGRWYQKK